MNKLGIYIIILLSVSVACGAIGARGLDGAKRDSSKLLGEATLCEPIGDVSGCQANGSGYWSCYGIKSATWVYCSTSSNIKCFPVGQLPAERVSSDAGVK